MSNRIIASFTLTAFLLLGAPISAQPAAKATATAVQEGIVEATTGSVFLLNDKGGPSGKLPARLRVGSTVRTSEDGEVVLAFPDGSRVRVAPGSEFKIVSLDSGATELALYRGRILGAAQGRLSIKTSKSALKSSRGEFVLETDRDGAGLRVFTGDASLQALGQEPTSYASLLAIPGGTDARPLLSLQGMEQQQTVGDDEFGAQKGKGKNVRADNVTESVGGVEDSPPDQDILAPGLKPSAPVAAPPPVGSTVPPVSGAVPPAAVATGGGMGWLGGLGAGLGLAGLLVALSNGDDDSETVFIGNGGGGGQPVPSPSLP